jgi:cystathionine beta-lyase
VTYDFDRIIDRRATDSTKWHYYDADVLPMWVADMDFRSPEPVIVALHARVDHGVFGYERAPQALREIIVARLKRLYGWDVAPEAILFLPGVVAGFNLVVQTLLGRGEGLLIQTPVYPPILRAGKIAGVATHAMSLTRRADGYYTIDFDLFARTITDRTRMFLLCNPHNPVGRVFEKNELAQMAELCLRHDLLICSDEIHGDLVFSGHRHRPIAALAPEVAARTITLMAPSKTFNVPGLHCAFAVIPDATLRAQFQKGRRGILGAVNVLGYTAALAAYRHGQPWLDALLRYLEANRDFAVAYIRQHMPAIHVTPPEGTYLAWLDCRAADIPGNPQTFFLETARVALNDGATFGPGGEGFVRLNFGCPRATLAESLARMRTALET